MGFRIWLPVMSLGRLTGRKGDMRKSSDLQKVEHYEVLTTGHTEGERCVNMSNALIRAGQGLSLAEKRLMASAVAMLDSMRTPRPGECPVVRISAADYAESFGLDIDTAYNQLQSGAEHLYGVLSRNRRKFRQPINVACPAPGRWGRPNSRVTSRHFDHGNASRTSRPDCSGLDEAD